MKIEALIVCTLQAILMLSIGPAFAENIDPCDDSSQYAYGENIGWINFEPNQGPGVTVTNTQLTGYVWAENIGWINLEPNDDDPNTGVSNDGNGRLCGFAWGENVGWIKFNPQVPDDPNHYGVMIDSEGNFNGWAWGENIGWICFQAAFVIDLDDLANFAAQWLETGSELEADLYLDERVNLFDFSVFADRWLNECPDDWRLGPTSYKVKTSWGVH